MKLLDNKMNKQGRETEPWAFEIMEIQKLARRAMEKNICKKRQN